MLRLSDKITRIPVSAPLKVDLAAKAKVAAGADVVNFCVGEPDFPTPDNAAVGGIEAIKKGRTKYTNASGSPELKAAAADALLRDYGVSYSPDCIVITTGAKYAVYAVVNALCNPGDEVIIPAPYWTSYEHLTSLSGAAPVIVTCKKENGFKLTPEQFEEAATERTRALIINNPNNPSGAVYSAKELKEIGEIAVKHNICIISDEIYADLVFDGIKFVSTAAVSESIKENTVIINGMSKSFAMTGWRIGYIAAPRNVAAAVSAMLSHTTGAPCTISQDASVVALNGPRDGVKQMREVFRERRDLAYSSAQALGIDCPKPQGAFYLMMDIRKYLKPGETATDFALDLLDYSSVALVPCEDFGMPGFLRMSFSVSTETVAEGFRRMGIYLKERRGING